MALCKAPTCLYDADRETVVVILHYYSKFVEATWSILCEPLTDMLCLPTLGIRLTAYATIDDDPGAGYYLRLACESGMESVCKLHLDVTASVRLTTELVSCACLGVSSQWPWGALTAYPSLRQRNIILAQGALAPGELLRRTARNNGHTTQCFVAAVCMLAVAVISPFALVGDDRIR